MATHIVVWPKVNIFKDGTNKVYDRGQYVPAGVASEQLANLVSFGAIAGVSAATEPAAEERSLPKAPTVEEILEQVGSDKELAEVALEEEKAGKNRKTLIEKLDAVLSATPVGAS